MWILVQMDSLLAYQFKYQPSVNMMIADIDI